MLFSQASSNMYSKMRFSRQNGVKTEIAPKPRQRNLFHLQIFAVFLKKENISSFLIYCYFLTLYNFHVESNVCIYRIYFSVFSDVFKNKYNVANNNISFLFSVPLHQMRKSAPKLFPK